MLGQLPSDLNHVNNAAGSIRRQLEAAGTNGKTTLTIPEKVMMQPDPVALFRDFESGKKPLMLAARVRGKVKTAFPDGPPPGSTTPGGTPKPEEGAATPAKRESGERRRPKGARSPSGSRSPDPLRAAEGMRDHLLGAASTVATSGYSMLSGGSSSRR